VLLGCRRDAISAGRPLSAADVAVATRVVTEGGSFALHLRAMRSEVAVVVAAALTARSRMRAMLLLGGRSYVASAQ
jgi:hypothetical protein